MNRTDTPRSDDERYESGPTAANYGVYDPDIVVNYTFAQELEREITDRVAQRDALVAALRLLLTHEGERVMDGIGIEHDSEPLESAKETAYALLARLDNVAYELTQGAA